MERWCQLTPNRFRYYKNKIHAYQHPGKPLISVPISDILSINKTKVGKNEVQIEFVLLKKVSTYISERSCLEKAYESPKRAASN